MDIKDYDIKGTTVCECSHEFTLKDFKELNRIEDHGFYANQIKHYSLTICPNCKKETILLLKQKGQTYVVEDIAQKENSKKEDTTIAATIENEAEIETSEDFICPECKKVCKNKIGLTAHMRTHAN